MMRCCIPMRGSLLSCAFSCCCLALAVSSCSAGESAQLGPPPSPLPACPRPPPPLLSACLGRAHGGPVHPLQPYRGSPLLARASSSHSASPALSPLSYPPPAEAPGTLLGLCLSFNCAAEVPVFFFSGPILEVRRCGGALCRRLRTGERRQRSGCCACRWQRGSGAGVSVGLPAAASRCVHPKPACLETQVHRLPSALPGCPSRRGWEWSGRCTLPWPPTSPASPTTWWVWGMKGTGAGLHCCAAAAGMALVQLLCHPPLRGTRSPKTLPGPAAAAQPLVGAAR